MKGQKLLLKIYILFVIVITVALIVLQILGSKTRIGYLTDFQLNTGQILELNNLMDIKEDFIIDDKLDEKSLNNYLLTNENIINYVYHFKMGYYDKVFKHNDIYGVYPDFSNLPDYIKKVEMDMAGSPYGNFVSSKIIEEDRIDNVNYILKIKSSIVSIFILALLIIFILCLLKIKKIKITYINKFESINIIPFLIPVLTLIMFTRNIYSITNPQLWCEDANVFLQGYLDNGIKSLFTTYAGYLHIMPRLIIIFSYGLSHLLNKGISLVPFFSVLLSTIIGAYCIGYVCSKKFLWLAPLTSRILLALLLCFSQASEIYYTPTNLHWLLGYFLFLVSINIIHYKSLPKGPILIMIFLSSLSSVFVIFIGLASIFLFLNYLYRLIKINKLKYNIKNISYKVFELLLVNFGLIIHAIVILFEKRVGSGNPSISYILEAALYLLVRIFVDIQNLKNIYIIIILMSLTAVSIKFLKLKYYYILLFYIVSIFMTFLGITMMKETPFYLEDIRYVFIPMSILLTFIISNLYLNTTNINGDKIKNIISISLIIIISINYIICNFQNEYRLKNFNWKEFSSMYYKNGKDIIFIPVNTGSNWGVNVNVNNILITNDFIISNNKLYISNIGSVYTNSFLYFVKNNNFDLNIITNNIYNDLSKYKYANKYYLINTKEIRNAILEIKLYTNNYNITDNFKIIQKIY